MAMSISSLSTKIQTEIIALYGAADNAALLKKFADAVAKAVYDEITQNAQATGTTTVSSGSSAGVWPTTVPPGGIT